jgi:glycosyltransferase involved in cell wall biosynthesis
MSLERSEQQLNHKIVFLSSSSKMSGVEFSTIYLASALESSGWDPVIVVPDEGDLSAECKKIGLHHEVLSVPRAYSVGFRVGGNTLPNPCAFLANAMVFLIAAFRVYRFLKRENPRLAVTKGLQIHFYGGLGCALARIPCVWHLQDRVSERHGVTYPLILSGFARLFAAHVIVDAQSIARQLSRLVPEARISVIWNGVDTREFSPTVDGSRIRHEWSVSPDDILIGVVARITPWKGQHILIEALARVRERHPLLRLVLVGTPMFDNDDYLIHLQDIVRRKNLDSSVIFAGFRRDLPEVLSAMDIYIHTSLEKDSSPLAVVSAMAAGKAIICSRLDGTAELLKDEESALLFSPGDATALAAQLERLVTDRSLRVQLGIAARQRALEELDLAKYAARCERVFLALTKPIEEWGS